MKKVLVFLVLVIMSTMVYSQTIINYGLRVSGGYTLVANNDQVYAGGFAPSFAGVAEMKVYKQIALGGELGYIKHTWKDQSQVYMDNFSVYFGGFLKLYFTDKIYATTGVNYQSLFVGDFDLRFVNNENPDYKDYFFSYQTVVGFMPVKSVSIEGSLVMSGKMTNNTSYSMITPGIGVLYWFNR